jgi:hypothetical protein
MLFLIEEFAHVILQGFNVLMIVRALFGFMPAVLMDSVRAVRVAVMRNNHVLGARLRGVKRFCRGVMMVALRLLTRIDVRGGLGFGCGLGAAATKAR